MLLPINYESYLPNVGPDIHGVFSTFYEARLYESPEELLMRAIFEDLINILAGGCGNTIHDGRHDKTYAEAVRDVLSDAVHPFTFSYLCQHFNVDIDAARKALLSRKPSKIIKRLNPDSSRAKQEQNRKAREKYLRKRVA